MGTGILLLAFVPLSELFLAVLDYAVARSLDWLAVSVNIVGAEGACLFVRLDVLQIAIKAAAMLALELGIYA